MKRAILTTMIVLSISYILRAQEAAGTETFNLYMKYHSLKKHEGYYAKNGIYYTDDTLATISDRPDTITAIRINYETLHHERANELNNTRIDNLGTALDVRSFPNLEHVELVFYNPKGDDGLDDQRIQSFFNQLLLLPHLKTVELYLSLSDKYHFNLKLPKSTHFEIDLYFIHGDIQIINEKSYSKRLTNLPWHVITGLDLGYPDPEVIPQKFDFAVLDIWNIADKLKRLSIPGRMSFIPKQLTKANKLEYLEIHKQCYFPDNLEKLTNLEVLDLCQFQNKNPNVDGVDLEQKEWDYALENLVVMELGPSFYGGWEQIVARSEKLKILGLYNHGWDIDEASETELITKRAASFKDIMHSKLELIAIPTCIPSEEELNYIYQIPTLRYLTIPYNYELRDIPLKNWNELNTEKWDLYDEYGNFRGCTRSFHDEVGWLFNFTLGLTGDYFSKKK